MGKLHEDQNTTSWWYIIKNLDLLINRAQTWCGIHSWCKQLKAKRHKNEENNENNRLRKWSSMVMCLVHVPFSPESHYLFVSEMLHYILFTNVLQFSGVFFKYAKYSSHIYKKIFQYYVEGYFTSFNHPSGEWKMRWKYTKF